MTLEGLGEQRKRGLAVRGENHPPSNLDTPPPRQYFPGSSWHSFYLSAKCLIKRSFQFNETRTSATRTPMAKTKFRPLHDRVVVRRITAEEKTKGGIIIPDTAQEKPQEGEVIAVGPGARDESGKLIPIDVKAGNRVLFGKWSGTEVKLDGEELLIMKESDIMGVIA
jgi:chaperonin GroES